MDGRKGRPREADAKFPGRSAAQQRQQLQPRDRAKMTTRGARLKLKTSKLPLPTEKENKLMVKRLERLVEKFRERNHVSAARQIGNSDDVFAARPIREQIVKRQGLSADGSSLSVDKITFVCDAKAVKEMMSAEEGSELQAWVQFYLQDHALFLLDEKKHEGDLSKGWQLWVPEKGTPLEVGRMIDFLKRRITLASESEELWQAISDLITCHCFVEGAPRRARRSCVTGSSRFISDVLKRKECRDAIELAVDMLGGGGELRPIFLVEDGILSRVTFSVLGSPVSMNTQDVASSQLTEAEDETRLRYARRDFLFRMRDFRPPLSSCRTNLKISFGFFRYGDLGAFNFGP